MAVTGTGAPARSWVRVEHPLQPFDARNVTPGALGTPSRSATTSRGWRAPWSPAFPARRRPFIAGDLPQLPVPGALPPGGTWAARPRGVPQVPARPFTARRGGPAAGGIRSSWAGWPPGASVMGPLADVERGAGSSRRGSRRARGQLPPGALGAAPLSAIGKDVTSLSARVRPCGRSRPQLGVALDSTRGAAGGRPGRVRGAGHRPGHVLEVEGRTGGCGPSCWPPPSE